MKASIRRRIWVSLAILLAASASSAQGGLDSLAQTTPEQRAGVQTELMKAKLALTAEQVPKVEAINLDFAKQMDPVIKGSERPMMKLRQAQGIDQQKGAALQAVLTPQQFQLYLASKKEMKQKLEERFAQKRQGATQ